MIKAIKLMKGYDRRPIKSADFISRLSSA